MRHSACSPSFRLGELELPHDEHPAEAVHRAEVALADHVEELEKGAPVALERGADLPVD